MARPFRIEYPGAFYHITSRGNERKNIFRSDEDKEKFLSYLQSSHERYGAVIHVYCLMTNHYHLMIETPFGNLSQVMRHINGSYTTYFNTRHNRSGHLFQGRYKSILIDADNYATELSRYVHLNPVRSGIVGDPKKYKWTSYNCYIGRSKIPQWLRVDFILGYFGTGRSIAEDKYKSFVCALINREHESPLKGVVASTVLGRDDFVNDIKNRYLKDKVLDRDLPALSELLSRPGVDEIYEEVKSSFGVSNRLSRKAAIYLCHKYSGETLGKIGSYFGISPSGVSQVSRRFKEKLERDAKLRKQVDEVGEKVKLSIV